MEQREKEELEKLAEKKAKKLQVNICIFIILILVIIFLICRLLKVRLELIDVWFFYVPGVCLTIFFLLYKPVREQLKENFLYQVKYERSIEYEDKMLLEDEFVRVEPLDSNKICYFLKEGEAMYASKQGSNILITIGSKYSDKKQKRVHQILPRGYFGNYYKVVEK